MSKLIGTPWCSGKKKSQLRRAPRRHGRRSLIESLEPRQMLDGAGLFPGNECPPDLDLSAIVVQTVQFGQPLSFNLFGAGATVIDLDAAGNPTGDTIRVVVDPDIGTDTPVGVTLSETGDFSWTPTETQVGLHTITVIAIDGGAPALADAETFQVRVLGNNQSPNLAAIADQQATVGEEIVVNVTASDPNTGDALTFFLDPNDAPTSATIEQTSNTTAIIRWTPVAGDLPGPASFTVLVTDDGSLPLVDSESFSVTLTSSNDAPDLAAIAAQTATVGTQMVVNVSATDANAGDTLTFALDKDNGAAPADAILQQTSNTTAIIRWTPDLADVGSPVPFRVLVTDNGDPAEGDSEDFQVTVSAAAGALVLAEQSNFRTAMTEAVALGQNEGTRTLAFNVQSAFDKSDSSPAVEDLFQVFLVDANNPAQTLLDNGKPGTAVFTLAGGKAEFQPGQVRYDGSRVEIDVTGLGALTTADLVFQLLNSDGDEGTKVAIGPITNTTNTEALAAPRLALSSSPISPGGAIDLGTLSVTSQVAITLQNVRFDPSTGDYAAELVATNKGPAIGRQLAVRFAGLPSDVTFENASGVDGSGDPYVNLTSAIGSGGLAAGASSRPVTIRLSNPNSSRFSLVPAVLSGGPNTAPILGEIAPITAVPGDYVEVQLGGQDADGDKLTYSLSSPNPLPGGALMADGRLIFKPAPGQEGAYDFTVTLSDGVESVTRSSSIVVESDPITTTRIEGLVLGTNGEALEGVPIDIGGFTTLTGPDGAFTIELPTLTAPSESFNITVPTGDPHLDPFSTGQAEIPFRRAIYNATTGTSADNPRQHPNLVSSFIDASMVYGSDDERASALRTFSDGKLKVSGGDLLPLNDAATFPEGLLQNDNEGREDPTTLFASGDTRTNENIALIALHTVLVREHNRLADDLKAATPSLTDEEIYQQARRLVGAMIQQITYNEYLPLLLGPDAIAAYSGYQSDVDPTQSELFASAAFRVGHSQVNAEFQRLDASGQPLGGGALSLQDVFFTTEPVKSDGIEPYLRGLAETLMQEIDVKIIDGVRNFLFGPPGAGGMDLAAMNVQRGRDVGLPSYTQARLDFGLSPITSFDQITSDSATRQALQNIYGTVDKVDIWIGGLAEDHAAGAMVGPLFQAIIADQFQRTRDGDRFWYENGQLTAAEMAIVRNTTLESLLERNAPGVDLPATPFTTGTAPTSPSPAGSTATAQVEEHRSIDGAGNHLLQSQLGAAGGDRFRNFTSGYGDGVSTPAGADRPGAREVSNAVSAQSGSLPNASGATALMTFWGQLIDHDMGLGPAAVSDTLRIQGDLRADDGSGIVYPFVAEKLPLVLGHDVYPGAKNVIGRPIYLPVLDVAGGTMIDPASDTMVEQEIAPGEMGSVFVEAGTLKMDNGTGTMVDFSGSLSITEVPTSLTPAALPTNLVPDTVVTIQPAEMVFTDPAELTLPNRGGYPPGTLMDLWSINPETGDFDKVGQGQVSADGLRIETVSGGIRNSSWHLFVPPPEPETMMPEDTPLTPDENCLCPKETVETNSNVELHSGALEETHDLATYQSQGEIRGVQLYYNSLNADPRPILHFGYNNIPAMDDRLLVAELEFMRGDFMYQVPGYEGGKGLDGGEHFWSLPAAGGEIEAALQADLSMLPTGVYDYTLRTGLFREGNSGQLTGSFNEATGEVTITNMAASAFGAGWTLAGHQVIVENPDGSVLLMDGGGTRLVFEPDPNNPGQYLTPPADFSVLEKLADGTFRRTTTNQTVYQFNDHNQLSTVTDRNSRVTEWRYDAAGSLIKWVDPAGLETTFNYLNGKVSSILDPTGRTTTLEHDAAGNLFRITDPDGTARTFGYDASHRLNSEVDQRGFREESVYNFAGRVVGAILKDGTEKIVMPAQTQVLLPPSDTINPDAAPTATSPKDARGVYADQSGSVVEINLNRFGQAVTSIDSEGSLPRFGRDTNNLVTITGDGRGNVTSYEYDDAGNVITIRDTIAGTGDALLSNAGTEFWLAFQANNRGNGNLSLFLTGQNTATATIEIPGISFSTTVSVTPGEITTVTIPGSATILSNDQIGDLGVHVTADIPISVYGLNQLTATTDGFLALPLGALGTEYLVMSSSNAAANGSQFAVVATQDNTEVTITPSVTTSGRAAGSSYSVTLQQGDTYQLQNFSANGDLSGTVITSNVPVAVFSGHSCDNVPAGTAACDHLVEQLPPTSTWGQAFVTAPLATRQMGDTFRILAATDDTDVFVNGDLVATINRGEVHQRIIVGAASIVTSKPALVAQFSNGQGFDNVTGDPFMAIVPPFEQFTNSYTISTPSSGIANNYINVVAPTSAVGTIRLDGVLIADDQFAQIAGTDFSGAQLTVSIGTHTLDSVLNFGVLAYGFDNFDSYGYLGGQAFSPAASRSFTYDPVFNQLTSFTDELGRVTLYEIDPANGNRLSTREIVGEVDDTINLETDDLLTTFTYTTLGLIDTTTDPLGRVTDFDYDSFGRLTTVTFAAGTADEAFQSFEYDTAGNQTAVIDENGNRTEFVYDTLDRLTQITEPDPDGAGPLTAPVTVFTYDARGNLLTTTDARGNVTTNAYDSLSRLASTTDADGQVTTFGYDMAGNLAQVTDPLGFSTHNVYDGRNRLIETTDPEGGVTQFAYDTDDNLISVLDPVGNETLFRYDARDRLVQETDPLGATTVYAYDAADNLTRKSDRNGRVTEFAYDDLDRLTTETWLGDDGHTAVNTIDYAYDKASNLLSVIDAFSTLAFTYDSRDRVDTVDNDGTPNTPRVVLDYGYDGVGNVTSVSDTIDGASGAATSYAYDALNRTTTIQQSGNSVADKLVDFVYNELGQFDEIARYSDLGRNNLVALSDYEYDELNRLTDLDHTNAADEVLAFYDFEYDPSSRITKLTDIDGVTDYSYDDRSQLTGADRDGTDARGDEAYTYDENGNRTDSHLHGDGYVTGDGNRLLSDGTYNYEYDAEGNMTKRTVTATGEYRQFEWDHRNRLVRVTDFSTGDTNTQNIDFAYDSFNRRIIKTIYGGGAGVVGSRSTLFVYDRDDVLLDYKFNVESMQAEEPHLEQRYMHGPGIDQVLAQDNASTQWLVSDHLGSVRDAVSQDGQLLTHIVFSSYGDVVSQSNTAFSTRYLYTGREFDLDANLYYHRARHYDPRIGRFVSEDPIKFFGSSFNLYDYARNSPILESDPYGLNSLQRIKKSVDRAQFLTNEAKDFAAGIDAGRARGELSAILPKRVQDNLREGLDQIKEEPSVENRMRMRKELFDREVRKNPSLSYDERDNCSPFVNKLERALNIDDETRSLIVDYLFKN